MEDYVDPALLEDPEWQAALRAAESPQPRRYRERRESPSARAGASSESYDDFLVSGGLPPSDELPHVVDLDASVIIEEPSGSARTTPSHRAVVSRSSSSSRPTTRPVVESDEDDSICIISPPQRNPLSFNSSSVAQLPPPSNSQNSSSTLQVPSNPSYQPSVIDLDHEYALQLQHELDREDDVILEIDDDHPGSASIQTFGRTPSASTVERHRAPEGPARGSFGVINRHGQNRREMVFAPLPRSSTEGYVPYQAQPSPSRVIRELPAYTRSNTAPVSPAHMAPDFPHHINPRYGSSSNSSNRGIGRSNSNHTRNTRSSRMPQFFTEDDAAESVFIVDEEDDDEQRLRSGVTTRATSRAIHQAGHRHLSRAQLAAILSGDAQAPIHRHFESDLELATALQSGIIDMTPPRRGYGNAGRGRARGRNHGRFGEFEVDTNDYEAMLRLSEQAAPVKRGASDVAISSLPVVKASNDDCTICQGTAETAMVALPCLHNFHRECILPHLKTSRQCPNCRHEVE